MKITCPQCDTAYDIVPTALGSGGRQVRCARCQNVWFAEMAQTPEGIIPFATGDAQSEPLAETVLVEPAAPADLDPAAEATPESGDPAEPEPSEAPAAETVEAEEEPDANAAAPAEELPAAAEAAEEPSKLAQAEPPKVTASDRKASAAASRAVEIEALAAQRPASRRPKRRPHPVWHARGLTAAIIFLFLIDAALIVGRADVVRLLPQTASLYEVIGLPVNLRDLTFKDIKTTQEQHEGSPILVIEGTIVATGWKPTDVPRLRFAISAANGHEIYAWTALPTRTKLGPGEALPFRTRLASPPEQGRTVKIRFFNRRDIATGLR